MEPIAHATSAPHAVRERIEFLPLVRRISGGTISRGDYLALLGQLLYVHDALEAELTDHPELAATCPPHLFRAESLVRDLTALDPEFEPADPVRPVTDLIEAFRAWSQTEPLMLLGGLHALDEMRGHVGELADPLALALGLADADAELEYHLGSAPSIAPGASFTDAERDDMARAAAGTTELLCELFLAVDTAEEPVIVGK